MKDEEKWDKIIAKKLLYQDIVDGTVTDEMHPEDVYIQRPEFAQSSWPKFPDRLKLLHKQVANKKERAAFRIISLTSRSPIVRPSRFDWL